MVDTRKIAGDQDKELEAIRAKQRAALSRGMTDPKGAPMQMPSTAPTMDPLMLQARNRRYKIRLAGYIAELEHRIPGLSSTKNWNDKKAEFLKMIEVAPAAAGPAHLRMAFQQLEVYLVGYCDGRGVSIEDVNKGVASDRDGLPFFLRPKEPGEDPEVA